jgi:hypothetical protein
MAWYLVKHRDEFTFIMSIMTPWSPFLFLETHCSNSGRGRAACLRALKWATTALLCVISLIVTPYEADAASLCIHKRTNLCCSLHWNPASSSICTIRLLTLISLSAVSLQSMSGFESLPGDHFSSTPPGKCLFKIGYIRFHSKSSFGIHASFNCV